ncbi:sodium channel subunit beta-4 [Protopterus annectens]|uniref:sodium channel subunit beta-4 n=1 Tax=Protopterus annectens TaxID=7888 RepID=UPI001CF96673|nr:sodium channel subunit beta-4 [Protopterus annectens]
MVSIHPYPLFPHRKARCESCVFLGFLLFFTGFSFFPVTSALETTVGKINTFEVLNGTDFILPCNFGTCIGFENLLFRWYFETNTTRDRLLEATIKAPGTEPRITFTKNDRIKFAGDSKKKNISILLENMDFEDSGKYICFVKNPTEKDAKHESVVTVNVVDKLTTKDNTLTIMIAMCVGGVIGLLIVIMALKALILCIINKVTEKKKECLVSSSGNDNTENGLSGSKAGKKVPPKA